MNRRERRAAIRTGDVISIDYGQLLQRDQNYGLPVDCYVCGTSHAASSFAHIEFNQSIAFFVPLCEPCLASEERGGNGVARKYLNAADLIVTDKHGNTQH